MRQCSLGQVCTERHHQKFIGPHCPWQNGKVERLNRTLQTEWAYRQVFTTNTARTQALAPWLEHYNTSRRHSALSGQPPTARLSPTCLVSTPSACCCVRVVLRRLHPGGGVER